VPVPPSELGRCRRRLPSPTAGRRCPGRDACRRAPARGPGGQRPGPRRRGPSQPAQTPITPQWSSTLESGKLSTWP
jgi:hypothetical protein